MSTASPSPHTPSSHHQDRDLEAWIAAIGEERLVEMFHEAERGVTDGTIQTFADPRELLEHLNAKLGPAPT